MTSFTYEELLNVFCYCPITGKLSWAITYDNFHQVGMLLTTLNAYGYIRVCYKRNNCSAHRLAWFLYFGAWPTEQIDHINGIKTDNRICNLRSVSNALNCQSKFKAGVKCESRHRGVTFNHRTLKFRAVIKINGKQKHIGTFWTLDEAVNAYNKTKIALNVESTLYMNEDF